MNLKNKTFSAIAAAMAAALRPPETYFSNGYLHVSRPMGYVRMPNQRQRRKRARQLGVALERR